MKSFDDALNKHKNNLSSDLVAFGEGKRVRRIMMDIDSNSYDYEYYFQAGAQSRQSEVDELKKKIAKALYLINMCEGHCSVDSIRKILEGENYES